MNFVRKIATIALFLTFSIRPTQAGNEHEHLQYLPSYLDLEAASNGTIGDIQAIDIFSDKRPLAQKVDLSRFNKKQINYLIENGSLRMLSEYLATGYPEQTSDDILRGFFEITEFHPNKLDSYLASTNIRNKLFINQEKLIEASVSKYLEKAIKSESIKSIFSVPSFMMEKKKTMANLQKLYSMKDCQTQFFLSIPRGQLYGGSNAGNLDYNLDLLSKNFNEPWMSGIDISGSILESNDLANGADIDKNMKKTLEGNLKKIFRISGENKMPIRIHAYERANAGSFYNTFWKTLENCKQVDCAPPIIRIGHINALDEDAIKKLRRLSKRKSNPINFLFEANLESNQILHDAKIEDLVKKIEQLHRNDFTVVMGSDGLGILGSDSNFKRSLQKLDDAGMRSKSIERLITDAHRPIPGMKMTPYMEALMKAEEVKLKLEMLGHKQNRLIDKCKIGFNGILRQFKMK
jgi:hypothetical protein